MAVLQENIFDIVKRANTKDFKTELSTWQRNSYAQSSTWSNMYKNGMIFKQFKSIDDSFKTIDEVRKDPSKFLYGQKALSYISSAKYNDSDSFLKDLNREDSSNKQTKEISKNILENIKSFIQLGGLYANDRLIITQDKRGSNFSIKKFSQCKKIIHKISNDKIQLFGKKICTTPGKLDTFKFKT